MSGVTIRVSEPKIQGESVQYSWTQDVVNLLQRENGFAFTWHGLDLRQFTPTLFLEILLAIQLRIWKQQAEKVELQLPFPLPGTSIDFWQAYHRAWNVRIGPRDTAIDYSPWSGPKPRFTTPPKIAVFYGGGRDSLTTTNLLGDIAGRDQVLLVRMHESFSSGDIEIANDQLRSRITSMALEPMQQLGHPIAEYTSTYASVANLDLLKNARAGYEKFTVASLPHLLANNAHVSTLGLGWLVFYQTIRADGSVAVMRQMWRPEGLNALGRHWQRVLGFQHQPADFNMFLVGEIDYRILFRRYDHTIPNLIACNSGRPDNQWCGNCHKCVLMLINSLANEQIVDGFPYERVLDSPRFAAYFQWFDHHPPAARGLNSPFFAPPGHTMVSRSNFFDLTNVIHNIDPITASNILSDQGLSSLTKLMAAYGNRYDDRIPVIPGEVIERLPAPYAATFAWLASTISGAPIVDRVPDQISGDNWTYHYDLAASLPHPLLELPHIKEN